MIARWLSVLLTFLAGFGIGSIISELIRRKYEHKKLIFEVKLLKYSNLIAALQMALNDMIITLKLPHQAAINCGRVIDTLKLLTSPVNTKPEKAWLYLRKNLQIERSYLELITKNATPHRQGRYSLALNSEQIIAFCSKFRDLTLFSKINNRIFIVNSTVFQVT